jgi:hypothetical protein
MLGFAKLTLTYELPGFQFWRTVLVRRFCFLPRDTSIIAIFDGGFSVFWLCRKGICPVSVCYIENSREK